MTCHIYLYIYIKSIWLVPGLLPMRDKTITSSQWFVDHIATRFTQHYDVIHIQGSIGEQIGTTTTEIDSKFSLICSPAIWKVIMYNFYRSIHIYFLSKWVIYVMTTIYVENEYTWVIFSIRSSWSCAFTPKWKSSSNSLYKGVIV